MSYRIPESFIQDLILRTDIVPLIEGYLPLKKAGRNFVACCPFHSEKTPSFSVSPQKQFYHCFGCGAHGNAISFVMEYGRKGFMEALGLLAARLGICLPEEGQDRQKQSKQLPLYEVLSAAMQFYQKQLLENSKALSYLEQRGVHKETLQRFAIGYAPNAWAELYQHLSQQSCSAQALLSTGLAIQSERGSYYDRFRDRILFPIRDRRGRVLGFGGRGISPDVEPKYLNSPETPVFHKGAELYGLYEVEQSLRELPYLIVVEGYMDVVMLSQQGILPVVATLGTATTKEHLQRLFRLTDRLIFCFDGDNAGQKAAWRALETSLSLIQDGQEVRFIFLPQDEDPDSFVRKQGKEGFEQALSAALSLSEFFFTHLSQGLALETPDGRAKLSSLAAPLLETLSSGAFRALMLDELAKRTRLSLHTVHSIISEKTEELGRPLIVEPSFARKTPVRLGLSLLLQYPLLVQCIDNSSIFKEVVVAGIELFESVVQYLQDHPGQSTASLLEHWRDQTEGRYLERLAVEELIMPEAGVEAEFKGVLSYLQKLALDQNIESLLQKASSVGLAEDERTQLQTLIQKQKNNV